MKSKILSSTAFIIFFNLALTGCNLDPNTTTSSSSTTPADTSALGISAQYLNIATQTWNSCVYDSITSNTMDFNVFVLGNLSQPSSDTQGRMVVIGNAILSNYSVGDQLSEDATRIDLLVGGDLNFSSGAVLKGRATYFGQLNTTNSASFFGGTSKEDHSSDLALTTTTLKNLSSQLALFRPNGSVNANFSGNTTSTTSLVGIDSTLNIFAMGTSDLANTNTLQLNAPAGSTALINIYGTQAKLSSLGMQLNGIDREHVIFNFVNATQLEISSISVEGSVLAPLADVSFPAGQINGNFIGGSMSGAGQFNQAPFSGCLPPAASIASSTPSQTTITVDGAPRTFKMVTGTDHDDIMFITENSGNISADGGGGINTAVFSDYAQYFSVSNSGTTLTLHLAYTYYVLSNFNYVQFGDRGFQVTPNGLVSVPFTPATVGVGSVAATSEDPNIAPKITNFINIPGAFTHSQGSQNDNIMFIQENAGNREVDGGPGTNTAVFPDYAQYFTYVVSGQTVTLHLAYTYYILNNFSFIQFGDRGYQVINGQLISVPFTPATVNVGAITANSPDSSFTPFITNMMDIPGAFIQSQGTQDDDIMFIQENAGNREVDGGAGTNTAVFPDYAQYFTYVVSGNTITLHLAYTYYILHNFSYVQFGDRGYQVINGQLISVPFTPATVNVGAVNITSPDSNFIQKVTNMSGIPGNFTASQGTSGDDVIRITENSGNVSVDGGTGTNTAVFYDYAQYFTYVVSGNTVTLHCAYTYYVLQNFSYIQFGDRGYKLSNGQLIRVNSTPAASSGV